MSVACACLSSSARPLSTGHWVSHWALGVAAAFGACTLLLFGFVYWRTAAYVTNSIDSALTAEARLEVGHTREQALRFVAERLHDATAAGNRQVYPVDVVDRRRFPVARSETPSPEHDRGRAR